MVNDHEVSWTHMDESGFKDALALAQEARERVEAHDTTTHHHGVRVAQWALMIARRLPGFNRRRLRVLEISALLHDYGKLMIPRTVLNKPGKLDDHEWALVRKHPEVGAMTAPVSENFVEKGVILWHHKWFDGRSYPAGRMAGHEIPIEARITAVADVFDAVTSSRSYHVGGKGKDPSEAIKILNDAAGTQLDPNLVALFKTIYQDSQGRDAEAIGIPTMTVRSVLAGEMERVRRYLGNELGDFDKDDPLGGSIPSPEMVDDLVQKIVRANLNEESARNIVLEALNQPLPESFHPEDLDMTATEWRDATTRAGNHEEAVLYMPREASARLPYLSVVVFQGFLWLTVGEQVGERTMISLVR